MLTGITLSFVAVNLFENFKYQFMTLFDHCLIVVNSVKFRNFYIVNVFAAAESVVTNILCINAEF